MILNYIGNKIVIALLCACQKRNNVESCYQCDQWDLEHVVDETAQKNACLKKHFRADEK